MHFSTRLVTRTKDVLPYVFIKVIQYVSDLAYVCHHVHWEEIQAPHVTAEVEVFYLKTT